MYPGVQFYYYITQESQRAIYDSDWRFQSSYSEYNK